MGGHPPHHQSAAADIINVPLVEDVPPVEDVPLLRCAPGRGVRGDGDPESWKGRKGGPISNKFDLCGFM